MANSITTPLLFPPAQAKTLMMTIYQTQQTKPSLGNEGFLFDQPMRMVVMKTPGTIARQQNPDSKEKLMKKAILLVFAAIIAFVFTFDFDRGDRNSEVSESGRGRGLVLDVEAEPLDVCRIIDYPAWTNHLTLDCSGQEVVVYQARGRLHSSDWLDAPADGLWFITNQSSRDTLKAISAAESADIPYRVSEPHSYLCHIHRDNCFDGRQVYAFYVEKQRISEFWDRYYEMYPQDLE